MDKNIEQVKDFRKNRGEKSYIIYIKLLNYYMFFNIHICTVKNLPYIKFFFNNHS